MLSPSFKCLVRIESCGTTWKWLLVVQSQPLRDLFFLANKGQLVLIGAAKEKRINVYRGDVSWRVGSETEGTCTSMVLCSSRRQSTKHYISTNRPRKGVSSSIGLWCSSRQCGCLWRASMDHFNHGVWSFWSPQVDLKQARLLVLSSLEQIYGRLSNVDRVRDRYSWLLSCDKSLI